jgi:hypothetical protein
MFVVASPVTTTLLAEELVKVCELVAVPDAVEATTLNVSIPLAVRLAAEVVAAADIATVMASEVPTTVVALAQFTVVSELAETNHTLGMYEPTLPRVKSLKEPLLYTSVTPENKAISNVVAATAFILTVSMLAEVTPVASDALATVFEIVRVSVPAPPSMLSPDVKVLAVELLVESNWSSPAPVVLVSRFFVIVKASAATVGVDTVSTAALAVVTEAAVLSTPVRVLVPMSAFSLVTV